MLQAMGSQRARHNLMTEQQQQWPKLFTLNSSLIKLLISHKDCLDSAHQPCEFRVLWEFHFTHEDDAQGNCDWPGSSHTEGKICNKV